MIELTLRAPDVVSLAHEVYLHYRKFVDMGWAPDDEAPITQGGESTQEAAAPKPAAAAKSVKSEAAASKTAQEGDKEVSFEDLEGALRDLVSVDATTGLQAATEALGKFKVDRLKALPKDQYPAALEHFQKLTAEAQAKASA